VPLHVTEVAALVRLKEEDRRDPVWLQSAVTVTADPFSVKDALPMPVSVGGSFTAVMLIVEVAVAVLWLAAPSFTVQVTSRVGAEP
jgi:hypothetical protein